MQIDRAQIAVSRARKDYAHHVGAVLNAETDRSRARHARRARVAAARIADARKTLARLTFELSGGGD
ncbi:MAG: hypothetical protein KKA05_10275 [Alphaproteobacteria bacterium]|nr:hypothetical protein [Alphaproteobacteria bacterium]